MPLIRSERRTPCRCGRCKARKTLAKHPDAYNNPPKCPSIGCNGLLRPDLFRMKAQKNPALRKKDSGKLCRCVGYHYPHTVQSVNCEKYENFVIDSSIAGRRKSDISENDGVPF